MKKFCSKFILSLLFTFFSSTLFAAKFTATNTPVYIGSSFGGYTTDCTQVADPQACCRRSDNPLLCNAHVDAYNLLTDIQVAPFFYSASLIDKLQNILNTVYQQKTIYCDTYEGQQFINTPQEITCSPKGIVDYFSNAFFYPYPSKWVSAVDLNIYNALINPNTPAYPTGYFTYCPGTFLYLCNLIGQDNCTSASSPFSINGQSFYDYIKSAITNPSFQESTNTNYYDWFMGKNLPTSGLLNELPKSSEFMPEYFKRIVLPFIKLAQQGQGIATSLGGENFGGLTNPIIKKGSGEQGSGEVWDSLDPWLQNKITSDFPSGVAFCSCPWLTGTNSIYYDCSPGHNGFGCCGIGWLIVMGSGGNSAGCSTSSPISTCPPITANLLPEGLYYKLLDCCQKNTSDGSSSTGMSEEGAAFLCSLTTAQYNILNQVLQNQTSETSLQSLKQLGIQNDIANACSAQEKDTINNCIQDAYSQGLTTCTNQGKCANQNDTSSDCIKCISQTLNSECYTPTVKDALQSCMNKAMASSEMYNDMQGITDSLTGMANARLQYAQFVKKFALNSDSLPTFTESSLTDKCLAFCNVTTPYQTTIDIHNESGKKVGTKNITIGPLNYKELSGWDDAKKSYDDEAQFLAQISSQIFGTCPKAVSGLQIFMEIMTFLGPAIGVGFVAFSGGAMAILMMTVIMALQEAGSIAEQIVQAQAQSSFATLAFEQEEDFGG